MKNEVTKTRARQEKYRQNQMNIMFRTGRPIFGNFDEYTQQSYPNSMQDWHTRIPMQKSSIRTYQEKYKTNINVFEQHHRLVRKIHDMW